MDVTLLSNQLEKLDDKLESLKKVLSPGDADALLDEQEAMRKEKNSEIKYLQEELTRARGRKNCVTHQFLKILFENIKHCIC